MRPAAPTREGSLGVVMLLGWNGLGGTQRQALKLSAHLRPRGVHPIVLTRRYADLAGGERVDGIDVHRVGRAPAACLRPLAFLGGFLGWALRHRRAFQVVHAHNLPAALTAALLRPLLGAPVVVKLPNAVGIEQFGRRRLGSLRWRVLREQIDRFVAVNAEIEARLLAMGVAAGRIARIPNGVEAPAGRSAAEAAALRQALGVDPHARVAVYLGRLIPDKGLAWLLRAWADVVPAEPESHLLIVGDGPDGARLRDLADRLGITDSVSFLGHRTDVAALLGIADVLVHPSRSEGMSNAVLEGMSHGLAIVASDVPGNRALVEPGREGLLVPYEDGPALTAALRALLGDADLRHRLGREAAAVSASTFSLDAVATAYHDLYHDLIARPRQAVQPAAASSVAR
jgi:glycosyltransferase involved in cell wall biosynthesis